jgi:hypothetical protein
MPVSGGPPTVIAYLYGGQGTINVPSWSPDGKKNCVRQQHGYEAVSLSANCVSKLSQHVQNISLTPHFSGCLEGYWKCSFIRAPVSLTPHFSGVLGEVGPPKPF